MIFYSNSNSNLSLSSKRPFLPMIFSQTFHSNFALEMGGAACSTPRVSGIDDAYGISTEHIFLSNCVMQVMRVWSLPALLSLLAASDPKITSALRIV